MSPNTTNTPFTPEQIIRTILEQRGIALTEFSYLLGYEHKTAVSSRFGGAKLSVDLFYRWLRALGYEMVATPKSSPMSEGEFRLVTEEDR